MALLAEYDVRLMDGAPYIKLVELQQKADDPAAREWDERLGHVLSWMLAQKERKNMEDQLRVFTDKIVLVSSS